MIAAIVLGVMALGALFFAFGGPSWFSSGTKVVVTSSTEPQQSASVPLNTKDFELPTKAQETLGYMVPVTYYGAVSAPDPGRNIFAFYEPPPPCRQPGIDCPTPTPKPVPPATPPPTPDIFIASTNPTSVYAGSRGFRLEINGERMLPDAKIYLSQSELKTTFINETRMAADVPAGAISAEGPRQIIIQTPDGKKYSNAVSLNVQQPPRPQFQYIGMIARTRSNNDTAYFMEQGRQTPMSARLNDIVGGRFRLLSISSEQTVFEDVNLGFKHKVALFRPPPGTATSSGAPPRSGFQGGETYIPFNSNSGGFQVQPGQSIPGIPDNVPRYVPPNANRQPSQPPQKKDDVDDDDGDGKP